LRQSGLAAIYPVLCVATLVLVVVISCGPPPRSPHGRPFCRRG